MALRLERCSLGRQVDIYTMCPRKEISEEIVYNLMSYLELPILSTKEYMRATVLFDDHGIKYSLRTTHVYFSA